MGKNPLYKSSKITNAGKKIRVKKRGKPITVEVPDLYIELKSFKVYYPGLTENRYDRMRAAVDLRRQGISYHEIGIQLGMSHQVARKDVQAWYNVVRQDCFENALEAFQMDMERLDSLLTAVMPEAKKGDEKKISSALQILKRRADMLGLDAPTRIDISQFSSPN